MIKNLPIKTICAVVLLLFVVWLWQSQSSDLQQEDVSLVPTASAVTNSSATQSASELKSALLVVDNRLDDDLANRLQKSAELIESNQNEAAINELNAIIKAKPNAIEAYINLAALYAKSENIDLAQQTLLSGIQVNENTAVLFDSLQKVYAAQASLAYQRALEIKTVDDSALTINLPTIDTLSLSKPSADEANLKSEVASLNQKLAEFEKERSELLANLETLTDEKQVLSLANENLKQQSKNNEQEAVKELQSKNNDLLAQVKVIETERDQLKQSLQSLEGDKLRLSLANKDLNSQIEIQANQQVSGLQSSNAELLAQLKQIKSEKSQLQSSFEALQAEKNSLLEANASFQSKLDQQQSLASKGELQQQLKDANAQIASLQTALENAQTTSVVTNTSNTVSEPQVSQKQQDEIAVSLVKSWANEWANQNVSAYIDHYVDNFTPGNGLSHDQWREQRRVRLTNKSFIEIDVDNFSVEDQGDKFAVTFMQHYRSNNVDDRIKKRLVFVKLGDDWATAKISSETVINR